MEPLVPDHSLTAGTSSWGIHGDPALLVEAARTLRRGIEMGVYRSHPPGEYAMFGVARLLDAVAFSMHIDGAMHYTVVSSATEIAHHVLTYLPAVERACNGRGVRTPPQNTSGGDLPR